MEQGRMEEKSVVVGEESSRNENEMSSNYSSLNPVLSQDPQIWMDYLYKTVHVTTNYGASYSGLVYTVDPVSYSIVLVSMSDLRVASVQLVMGHAVKNVTILDDTLPSTEICKALDSFFKPEIPDPTSVEEIECRKTALCEWFERNKIPVETREETVSIANSVFIHPPYTAESYQSSNVIMLDRIQTLMSKMPPQSIKDGCPKTQV